MELNFAFLIGDYISNNCKLVFAYSLLGLGIFALITFRKSLLGFSISISSTAVWIALGGNLPVASILFAVAFALAVLSKQSIEELSGSKPDINWLLILSALAFAGGIILRIAYLDSITTYFEGELAPYMAAGSSIKGSMYANKGINGPWAPLGILYYLPIYLCYQIFGISLWSVRFSSALVGISTIIILFFVAKRLFNLKVALLSVTLFSLNYLHIGWSRTDVHPHGVTAWPALLVALATFIFFEKKTFCIWRSLFLILTMALTWHQYPSGQSAVAIPFIATILLFASGGVNTSQLKFTVPVLCSGALLWYLGLPISYYLADGKWEILNPFTLTTRRTSWGNTADQMDVWQKTFFVVDQAWQYFLDVLMGLIYKAPFLHHQDYVAQLRFFEPRTYTYIMIPFTICGLAQSIKSIKYASYAALIGMLIAALAPGILSESPVPKRLSVTFLVLDILSAIGIVQTISLLINNNQRISLQFVKIISYSLTIVGICFLAYQFFSGKQYEIREPIEISYAEIIKAQLRPNTLVVADVLKDYDSGKLGLLLLEDLYSKKNQPIFIAYTYSKQAIFDYADDPKLALYDAHRLPRNWIYLWTKLRDIFDTFNIDQNWERTVFILQFMINQEPREQFESRIKIVQDKCRAKVNYNYSTVILEAERSFQNPMALITCEPSQK